MPIHSDVQFLEPENEIYSDKRVSWFSSCTSSSPHSTLALDQIISSIKTGQFKNKICDLRELHSKEGRSQNYKLLKQRLDCFSISGIISQNRSDLIKHSEYIQLDFDDLKGQSIKNLKNEISCDSFIRCCFISPSGVGLKTIARIDPSKHKESFDALTSYYQEKLNLEADPKTGHEKALCFISYDPEIHDNPKPTVFNLNKDTEYVIQSNCYTEEHSSSISLYNTKGNISPLYNNGSNTHTSKDLVIPNTVWDTLKSTHTALPNLFKIHIIPKLKKDMCGKRNDTLVDMVAFLYQAYCPEVVMLYMGLVYEIFKDIFNDPLERHRYEVQKMLEGVKKTYIGKLTPYTSEIYSSMNKAERDAFRVCMSLALDADKPNSPKGSFFLSCNQLAARIGFKNDMQAGRLLFKLSNKGIIKVHKKGKSGTRGAKATEYKWILKETETCSNQTF